VLSGTEDSVKRRSTGSRKPAKAVRRRGNKSPRNRRRSALSSAIAKLARPTCERDEALEWERYPWRGKLACNPGSQCIINDAGEMTPVNEFAHVQGAASRPT
jgi:hypothetical protein